MPTKFVAITNHPSTNDLRETMVDFFTIEGQKTIKECMEHFIKNMNEEMDHDEESKLTIESCDVFDPEDGYIRVNGCFETLFKINP